MSEMTAQQTSGPSGGGSPLQRARLEQGLSLETLAAQIKVTPAKLEALEAGRYQDLPDPAFARALAMTVCRVLKIDPASVMASLPAAQPVSLAASETREVPFEASRTRLRLNIDRSRSIPWAALWVPRFLAPLGVLLAAVAVYFWPADIQWSALLGLRPVEKTVIEAPVVLPAPRVQAPPAALPPAVPPVPGALPLPPVVPQPDASAPAVAAPAGSSGPAVAAGVSPTPAVLPVPTLNLDPAATPPAPGQGPLVLVATQPSWVEVRDGQGRRLLSRNVAAGETVDLDGPAPLRVRIGNASGMRLSYRGNPVDLAGHTRNNVARLELK